MSDGLADTLIRPRVTAKIGDRASVHRGTGTPVPLLDREAWRDALLAWVGQVALVFAVIYIGRTLLLTQQRPPRGASSFPIGWDGIAATTLKLLCTVMRSCGWRLTCPGYQR